ncbi:MAG: hypothetical protein JO261_01045, partial [Alphaproteobacteria bacterium]|nr:hypothetical protein [Alphaproteobacteria bacterium]
MDWRSRITAGETYPPSVVADGAAAHGLADVRIHVLRNFTVDGIEPLLKRQLGAIGYFPKLAFGGYGTMMQDALAHPCGLVDDAELLLVALTLDELDREYGKPGWTHQGTRDELGALFDLLASRTRATIVVNTFLPPLYPEHGLWPTRDGSDTCSQVAELNSFVLGYAREHAP